MHQCIDMKSFIENPEDPVNYDHVFREYYISSLNGYNIITLEYCPWCAAHLPKSLRRKFFDILEQEYKIETNIGEYKNISLPQEFLTDEWWKKRGL